MADLRRLSSGTQKAAAHYRRSLTGGGAAPAAPAAPAKSRATELSANRAAYEADRARLRSAKAKANAPKGLIGERYDVLSGAKMSPPKASVKAPRTSKPKMAPVSKKRKG